MYKLKRFYIFIFMLISISISSNSQSHSKLFLQYSNEKTVLKVDEGDYLKITTYDKYDDLTKHKGAFKVLTDSTILINNIVINIDTIYSIRKTQSRRIMTIGHSFAGIGTSTIALGTYFLTLAANHQTNTISEQAGQALMFMNGTIFIVNGVIINIIGEHIAFGKKYIVFSDRVLKIQDNQFVEAERFKTYYYEVAIFPIVYNDSIHENRFTPKMEEIDEAEFVINKNIRKILKDSNLENSSKINVNKLLYNKRQYFGYHDSNEHKILLINGYYTKGKSSKLKTIWLKKRLTKENCNCDVWNIKYDLNTKMFFDFQINYQSK